MPAAIVVLLPRDLEVSADGLQLTESDQDRLRLRLHRIKTFRPGLTRPHAPAAYPFVPVALERKTFGSPTRRQWRRATGCRNGEWLQAPGAGGRTYRVVPTWNPLGVIGKSRLHRCAHPAWMNRRELMHLRRQHRKYGLVSSAAWCAARRGIADAAAGRPGPAASVVLVNTGAGRRFGSAMATASRHRSSVPINVTTYWPPCAGDIRPGQPRYQCGHSSAQVAAEFGAVPSAAGGGEWLLQRRA